MNEALNLKKAHEISRKIAKKYSLDTLKTDMESIWPALK